MSVSPELREELPLFGLPVLIKDNIDVAGHTRAGSAALSDNVALSDAPVIVNIRRRGGIILGKTNMIEFANFTSQGMPAGYSSAGGYVTSAYGASADPGGSSNGSAVALSTGFCALSVGTDTSFSVVACAASIGVVGLKPCHGALSTEGIVPISHTIDSPDAFGRTLDDALLLVNAMSEGAPHRAELICESKLRLALNIYGRDKASDAQLGRYARLLDDLRSAGASVAKIEQPYTQCLRTLMLCEFRHDLERYLAISSVECKTLNEIIAHYERNPDTMMKYGITHLRDATIHSTDDVMYAEALAQREELRARTLHELCEYDACIMTGPTNIMHFTGLPSLSLPMCTGDV